MTMPTYEVSGIAIAAVEAETEVDAQRELAGILARAGVQYYVIDCQLVRGDTDGNTRQGSEHTTGQHESARGRDSQLPPDPADPPRD